MIQIGKVAKRSGVGVETVRYYEREGLIPEPDRSASGYRLYSETVVKQVQFIQHAKTLGFSLKEIGELIALKTTSGATCKSVRVKATAKVENIQHKIDSLEKMKAALLPLIDECQANKPISDCPILNALDESDFK
ncbi:MAG: heavy metal-responsive transcriptional regulator [Candidatus Scalindua sp.]|nr:heavy metal-responsive transcriptional regulator [Candidatus Scalindua sp.]